MNRFKGNRLPNLVYAIVWLVVFMLPVGVHYQSGELSWGRVWLFWMRVVPFFVLFVVNNCVLVPRLMSRRRWGWYVAALVATIFVLFSVVQPFLAHNALEQAITREIGAPPPMHGKPPMGRMPMMLNDWLVAVLVVGFNVAIRYIFKSIRDEEQIRELEAHRLQAELNYLKAQINPHFFMNTLNNIHALIDIDSEKAKESVIELSKIMRYVLYEADKSDIMLSREVVLIENYISLMRIRFSDEIDIRVALPDPVPEVRVPPMLLVTLVENAFKHGISYRRDSFIHISLAVAEGRLAYRVENSVGETATEKPGVGMENMRKRLGLLFGEQGYALIVRRTMEKHSVTLEIPVQQ
ncbi:MAG: histidine kinase [Alistipes sp.]|jgi:two-component sensor histidine kinase|nr:histidine kinase [Alistipes sp.]